MFFKYFIMYFCSFYCSRKIIAAPFSYAYISITSAFISGLNLFVAQIFHNQVCFLPLIIFVFLNILQFKNIKLTLQNCIISYALVLSINTVSSIIMLPAAYFLHSSFSTNSIRDITVLTSILTVVLTFSLFCLRRFKGGMSFLFSKRFSKIGLSIALCIIFLGTIAHITPKILFSFSFLIQLLACLLLIPFIAWWRSQLTKSYRQYLRDMETRELQTKVQQLSADNQRLSQIVHKDNKLITAMTSSVLGMIEQALTYSPERLSAYSSSLYRELLSLSSHRQDSLSQLSGTLTGQFHTGYMMLDSVLNLQAKQAHELGVDLSVEHNDAFFQNIFSFIDEEQLAHITADLVQNAIIATQKSQNKSVEISFISNTNTTSIQVSDSGVEFPAIVLDSLGRERCSQHLQDGGSGIGLMDIWALKNTTRATLLIEELPDGATFTKRVHIIFDNKNRFIIMSDRKDELSTHLHRPDVIVLAPSK